MRDNKKLGEILVDLGVLSPAQVEQVLWALRRRGARAKFGRVAREMGLVGEEHILAAVAVQMKMFPGIENLSLMRLLSQLQQPLPAAVAAVAPQPRRSPATRRPNILANG